MRCGLKENRKGKVLPPCGKTLDDKGNCPIHCRADTRTCKDCGRRYLKEEKELSACPQCKAPRPCPNRHKKGRRGCRMHGGSTPVGLASPNTQDGEHSRYMGVLSPRMKQLFDLRAKDLDKLSLDPEINLLHARVEFMMERIKEGESWASWRHAQEAFEEFAEAQSEKKRDKALEALQKLGAILRRGVDAEKDWEQIDKLSFVRKPNIVKTEIERARAMFEIMERSFVIQIFSVIAEGVKRRVKELPISDEERKQIVDGVQSDIKRLAGGGYSEPLPVGDAGGDDED